MKKLLIVLLVLVVALGGVGYWRGWFSVGDGHVKGNPEQFNRDKEAVAGKAKVMKDKIAGLFKKTKDLSPEEKAKVEKEIAELQQKHDDLEKQLKAVEEASEDNFAGAKETLTKSLEEIDKKMEELTKKLEKKKEKDK
jgi:chromosome segregation ATPase